MTPRIASLHVYPLKSAAGIDCAEVRIAATGFAGDRAWLAVDATGRFLTQRESPALARVRCALEPAALVLRTPSLPELRVAEADARQPCEVAIWRDRCAAFDAGEAAADWLHRALGRPARLVRFDASQRRLSNREWTGGFDALNAFSDGFPVLILSRASLEDLNRRLGRALPMNRFRPNLVLEGVQAYDEDRMAELVAGPVRLRIVKPCTRCIITTTDQSSGERDGEEPLRTLRGYRYDEQLKGVCFAQNAIVIAGVGARLSAGSPLEVVWKRG